MSSRENVTCPINMGNPQEFTINELALKVPLIVGSSSKIEYLPLQLDDSRQRKPDISLYQDQLGWQSKTELSLELLKTSEYFLEAVN